MKKTNYQKYLEYIDNPPKFDKLFINQKKDNIKVREKEYEESSEESPEEKEEDIQKYPGLLEYQEPHVDRIMCSMKKNNRALDCSDPGTGKTYTSAALCVSMGLKPFIICPRSVIIAWRDVLKKLKCKYYGISNYETLQNCRYYPENKLEKEKCKYIKRTKETIIKKNKKKIISHFEWKDLPDDIILIFDEAHKCKNIKTSNSKMLYSASITDVKILMLSATIIDKIEKFAMAGFVLRFYNDIKDYPRWLKGVGADYDNPMIGVHNVIYPDFMSRMRIKDLGDIFPENKVKAECFDMTTKKEIEEQYKIIQQAVEDLKTKEEQSCALAQIIYARQRIEMLRVPTFVEIAKKYIKEGKSPVIFVNFTESLLKLGKELNTGCFIYGEQSMEERDKNIKNFNKDKERIIIANCASGGVGISLHDTIGKYPRVSIISPSWSMVDIIQCLGRIFRANTKSAVEQFIVFCKGTIEDEICKSVKSKIQNLAGINDGGNPDSYKIEGFFELDDQSIGVDENDKLSEFDKTFQKINVLNIRKERLSKDITETETELKKLNEELNIIIKKKEESEKHEIKPLEINVDNDKVIKDIKQEDIEIDTIITEELIALTKPIIKDTKNDGVKEVVKEVVKEGVKETIKDVKKDYIKEVAKDVKKDYIKEVVKDVKKDNIKDVKKDNIKEVIKDVRKDNIKDVKKDNIKEVVKDVRKDNVKEGVKDGKTLKEKFLENVEKKNKEEAAKLKQLLYDNV